MAIDNETLKAIKKKSGLYEAAKERITTRIKDNIDTAIKRLKAAENELLREVEIEFEDNPFSEFLGRVISGKTYSDDEIEAILSREVSDDFGPSEESFRTLLDDIESFKARKKKKEEEEEEDEEKEEKCKHPDGDYFELIPQNLRCTNVGCDRVSVVWDDVERDCIYEIELKSLPTVTNIYHSKTPECTICDLKPKTDYYIRARIVIPWDSSQKYIWSNPVAVQTESLFSECVWKKCPCNVDWERKYSVDEDNSKVVTKINSDKRYCTIVGDTPIPVDTVISWNIKVLKTRDSGTGINIGVAPSDINQNDDNYNKCGWYFYCFYSTLISGPPHNYIGKTYGPRKGLGGYVHAGDSVGVVMDTKNGELSFIVDGVNLGVAYAGIPLDKPLVPCVLLWNKDDSIELDLSEAEENVNSSIPIPSNIATKNGNTWDSIVLTWDKVDDASFYQIEVDGSKELSVATTNTLTKAGFSSGAEPSFRIRTIIGKSVSMWSDIVKWKTQEESFETSGWKKCPSNVNWGGKYFIDESNSRVATKINDNRRCTIIGNTNIPVSAITSWNVKVLKSRDSKGSWVFIGVSPSDIDQNVDDNYNKCGWYFYCYQSMLWSGPPHNFRGKAYGPRKENGEYVHTGDSVGVVMDTKKGELSFVLNGVDLGVAYKRIPLDKPLVPCVLLKFSGDSVEFVN